MKDSRLLPLMSLLFLLASCGLGTPSQPASLPTPSPPPTLDITPTPTIPNVSSRLVHFLTSDHVQLAGLLYGHGKTAVICSHELRTNKIIWSASGIVQRLAAHGYLALAYDFRGNGDSAGQFDASKLAVDLRAAIVFVQKFGATRIILLGSSMGGTATLKVAANQQVAAVITLSAPQEFGVNISDAEVKAIRAPKLFVNSKNDGFASDTMHMYSVARPPKEIQMYPGSAHGTSMPFLCVLATTPEGSATLGKRHKTVGMWARQMVKLVRRWFPTLPITLLGDTAYSILELGLQCQEQQVTLITPFHLDAALHEPPPTRDAHTIGRPRVVGQRLPSLEEVLSDPTTTWQRLTLDWYGQGERPLEICTGTALWYRAGFAPLPHPLGPHS